jgi:xylose isomerase
MNPGGGRFYAETRDPIGTLAKLDRMKAAGIVWVEGHDSDVLDLVLGLEEAKKGYPTKMTEQEKMELCLKAAEEFKKALDERQMAAAMWTMNLFNSDKLFVFGNIGSEVDDARDLAIARTEFGMEIAQDILGCIYVLWNGTLGVDGRQGGNHCKRNGLIRDALRRILRGRLHKKGDAAHPLAAEAKPEEPKRKMYLPVTQSVLALSWRLAFEEPDLAGLLGVNPEVGHEEMAKLDPAMTYGEALDHGLLYHTHLNDQGGDPAFDRDRPAGSECLRQLVDIVWQLKVGGYRGKLGIDAQPCPTDTNEQHCATIATSAARIRWAVDKAKNAIDDATLAEIHARHNQHEVDRYIDEVVFGISM